MTGSDAHLAHAHAKQQSNSAQQKGGRACDRLFDFVIPGAHKVRTMVRSCAPEHLEIPGLVLTHHPGMTG